MIKKPRKQAKIFKIGLSGTSESKVIDFAGFNLEKKHKFYITTPNPEILLESRNNEKLRDSLNMSDVSIPDGVGIGLFTGLKVLKGREMMVRLFECANEKGLKVFLLGSSVGVNRKSVEKIRKIYPNVIVKGDSGPKLNKNAKSISLRDSLRYKQVIRDVNVFQPDILFVAFGAPKQEIWVIDNWKKLKVGGVMVVGGSLDYFSGEKRMPPKIFEVLYIEWLWRFLAEFGRPNHIRRIFNAVFVFPLLVVYSKMRGKER